LAKDALGQTIGKFDAAYAALEKALALVAAAGIFFLMLVGVMQVVGRNLFDWQIYGYIDWIEQSSAFIAFLGIAYCQKLGGHVRMEIALASLPKRLMWAGEFLMILLALFIVTLLIDSSFQNFLRAWQIGDSTMDIRLPIWPSKLVVPVALSALWLRLVIQIVGYGRLFLSPDAPPVAVPIVVSAEEAARQEIEDTIGRTEGRGH
jgi:TRAP-type mannitol/chloroaromatic compound transport system permease small subunit